MNQSIFSPNSRLHSTMRQTAADKGSVIKRLLAQTLLTLGCKSPSTGYHSAAERGWERHPAGMEAQGGGRHSPLPSTGLGRPERARLVICSSPDGEGKLNVKSLKLSPGLPSGQEGTAPWEGTGEAQPGLHRWPHATACNKQCGFCFHCVFKHRHLQLDGGSQPSRLSRLRQALCKGPYQQSTARMRWALCYSSPDLFFLVNGVIWGF